METWTVESIEAFPTATEDKKPFCSYATAVRRDVGAGLTYVPESRYQGGTAGGGEECARDQRLQTYGACLERHTSLNHSVGIDVDLGCRHVSSLLRA